MRMWLTLIYILLGIVLCRAQAYKYISMEDGLTDKRVYVIQQDHNGYMWILTHGGLDRYDGSEVRHFRIPETHISQELVSSQSRLLTDQRMGVWLVGQDGSIYRYDEGEERMVVAYRIPVQGGGLRRAAITYSFMDKEDNIWMCDTQWIYLYRTHWQRCDRVYHDIGREITCVEQTDDKEFFIGTESGVHFARLEGDRLFHQECAKLDTLDCNINEIYHHRPSRKVFIGTAQQGIIVYDLKRHEAHHLRHVLADITISRICPLQGDSILLATEGAGVFLMDTRDYRCTPYITADHERPNAMNGDDIKDLYIDARGRIWMAVYPTGITVRNDQYPEYLWLKHSRGNSQSLVNNQVNAIIEDSDGDLWFATNNGVSLYESGKGRWHTYLNSGTTPSSRQSHTFVSLCEVEPGVVWTGGYNSGIYQIDKRGGEPQYILPSQFNHQSIRSDKYIRVLTRDSLGYIWAGGYHNLKRIDARRRQARLYPGVTEVTDIVEQNDELMWIATAGGLYLLERESGRLHPVRLPVEPCRIHALCLHPNGWLYIGTDHAGLLAYHPQKQYAIHYHMDNCSLISNNIYTILADHQGNILLGTDRGLSLIHAHTGRISNWTQRQGLQSDHFNETAGTLRRNGHFILGSIEGALEFDGDVFLPHDESCHLMVGDLQIAGLTEMPIYQGMSLSTLLTRQNRLHLRYDQRHITLRFSAVNYTYSPEFLYSWRLPGYIDEWSRPSGDGTIRLRNLPPGKYTLTARALSNEDRRVVLDQRSVEIEVEQPFWLTPYAWALYLLLPVCLVAIGIRIWLMRKEREISDEKIDFFIHTAHDIRTPLTLIKAPLEELSADDSLSESGRGHVSVALGNVDTLIKLTTNLLNFEQSALRRTRLTTTECELGKYLRGLYSEFAPFAASCRIALKLTITDESLTVWMDREKIDSILRNLLSNALKYTPAGGTVHIMGCSPNPQTWNVAITDTGIGIPAREQRKMFKRHFRASNAINMKVPGSGVGLLLVRRLVRLHGGEIYYNSIEGSGTTVTVSFPIGAPNKGMDTHPTVLPDVRDRVVTTRQDVPCTAAPDDGMEHEVENDHRPRLMLVEDNEELGRYLERTLDEYQVLNCTHAEEAMKRIADFQPDILVSDIMMPGMRGDELCQRLKADINTSHIPVILLTALATEQDIINGLNRGADRYIPKPFSVGVLRAAIANLLANRALLRRKYAHPDEGEKTEEVPSDTGSGTSDLDNAFMQAVQHTIDEHLDDTEFNVDILCGQMNMSRTSFYYKIKSLTGMPPADYVRLFRLHRAAGMLASRQYSVAEVADRTGFNDAKYFREVFKRYYKVSPTQYAKGEGEEIKV